MTAVSSVSSSVAESSANIQVTKLAQDQQKADGKAAVSLIQTAGQVQQPAPAPTGDGTGARVNVLA